MANLFSLDPKKLHNARTLCHLACQWPSKAARANIAPAEDDSHSNLGWLDKYHALVSHPLDAGGTNQLGFSFVSSALIWLQDNELVDQFELQGESNVSVDRWVDAHLESASLTSTKNVFMPYTLAEELSYSQFKQEEEAVRVLGDWFAYGHHALGDLVKKFADQCVETPRVRCWPHHFDIGTLFVLEAGDPETARSIGAGLAPGDGSFSEPYFYCSPYPAPKTGALGTLPAPLFWNTENFVSIILKGSDLNEKSAIAPLLIASHNAARQQL